MAIRKFKDYVLDFIKENNAKCTLANLHIHFLNESGSLTVSNHVDDITQAVKELIETEAVRLNIDNTLQIIEKKEEVAYKEDLKKSIINFIRYSMQCYNLDEMITQYVPFLPLHDRVKEGANIITSIMTELIKEDIVKVNEIGKYNLVLPKNKQTPESKNMNIEPDQLVIKLSEEQTNILQLIKEHFQNYFGIDLTEQQAVDRVFRMVKDVMNPDIHQRRNQPVKSFGETECRIFSDPNWNHPHQGVNRTAPFNPQPFIRPVGWSNHVGQAARYTPDMENFISGIKDFNKVNQSDQVDFNSLKAKQNSDEGPYAHLYPGFKNMILADRETRNNTEAMKADLIKAGFLTEQKKKRSYTKKPKK